MTAGPEGTRLRLYGTGTGQPGLLLMHRSRGGKLVAALRTANGAFRDIVACALAMLAATLHVEPLVAVFMFGPPGPVGLVLGLVPALLLILVLSAASRATKDQ